MNKKNINGLYVELFQVFEKRLVTFLDKPEESVHANICALWYLATKNPVSAEGSMEINLPELTEEQIQDLRGYLEERLTGFL